MKGDGVSNEHLLHVILDALVVFDDCEQILPGKVSV